MCNIQQHHYKNIEIRPNVRTETILTNNAMFDYLQSFYIQKMKYFPLFIKCILVCTKKCDSPTKNTLSVHFYSPVVNANIAKFYAVNVTGKYEMT